MECLKCYNDMFIDYIVFNIERIDYDLDIKKLPAYVCSACNETYIEEEEMKKIFETIKELDKKIEKIKLRK